MLNMNDKKELTELEAQRILAEIMNDTPTSIVIAGTTYHITGLKLGVQNLIAEESVKIQQAQEGNVYDLYKQFAQSIPAVIRCIAYAVLNDKDKIFSDYSKKEFSDEFQTLYEQLEWESDKSKFIEVLVNVINKIDISFFYQASGMLTMMRDYSLKTRKKEIEHT